MRRIAWTAVALLACAVAAWIAVGPYGAAVVAVVVGVVALVAAPRTLLAGVGVAAVLVSPEVTPALASVGGLDVRATDLALVYVTVAAALRGTASARMDHTARNLTVALVAWGLIRTNFDPGVVSFLRLVAPVALAWSLPRLVDLRRLWTVTATAGAAIVVVAPFLTVSVVTVVAQNAGDVRLAGLAGGPNQLGSIAAMVAVVGWLRHGLRRWTLLAVGALGLFYSRSISSMLAAAVALLVAQALTSRNGKRRPFAPIIVAALAVAAVVYGPQLRGDTEQTLEVHARLASAIGDVLAASNIFIGSGWRVLPPDSTTIGSLHVMYLDWLAYLGGVGLLLLAAWMVRAYRAAGVPEARAVLVMLAIWFVTTGAFPAPAWGLLGIVLACARTKPSSDPSQQVAEESDRDRLRRPRRSSVHANLDHAASRS